MENDTENRSLDSYVLPDEYFDLKNKHKSKEASVEEFEKEEPEKKDTPVEIPAAPVPQMPKFNFKLIDLLKATFKFIAFTFHELRAKLAARKAKKKEKPPKKKKEKKAKKEKKPKKNKESKGGKKKLIIIAVLVVALAGGGFFLAKTLFGGKDEEPVKQTTEEETSFKAEDTGIVDVDTSEQDTKYTVLPTIYEDGVDITAEGYDPDWYKVTFTYRYGHQNAEKKFDVIDFTDYLAEVEAEKKAEAEKLKAEKEAADASAEAADSEATEEAEASEDEEDAEKSEKSEDKESAETSEESAESAESADGETAEGEAEEEVRPVELMYERVQDAEARVKKWAQAMGTINSYRAIGNEGYKELTAEFSQKLLDEQAYKPFRDALSCSMMFANMNSFEITKTLMSNDYKYAYVEFTRNLNVSRCINPDLFKDTALMGIQQGEINLQRFQMELVYNEEEGTYYINRIRLLKTIEQVKVTEIPKSASAADKDSKKDDAEDADDASAS